MKKLNVQELTNISGGCIIGIGNFLRCLKTFLRHFRLI